MTPPLLEVKNLSIAFETERGRADAVIDSSFKLEAGGSLAIVGESGSGKSVTALALTRLLPQPPAKFLGGEILWKGADVLKMKPRELRKIRGGEIAYIFQEPSTSLNPVYPIRSQIAEAIRLHRPEVKDVDAEIVHWLDAVGIVNPAQRMHDYPHQLSGGMQQRAMIAMALSCQPDLLVADEPTTALDVTIQAQILELMKGLSRRLGAAMLIITHNLGVVARYADRVNVMYAGRIIERGTARELYGNPSHPYTLGLLRSVPRLDEPRRARLAPIEGQPPDLTRLPAGCSFAPRCAFRVERCAFEVPPLMPVGATGHVSACWEAARLVKDHEPVR